MERTELAKRLKAVGVTPAQMCRDLKMVYSTYSRWDNAPRYAVAYLVAHELAMRTDFKGKRWVLEFQHKMATES